MITVYHIPISFAIIPPHFSCIYFRTSVFILADTVGTVNHFPAKNGPRDHPRSVQYVGLGFDDFQDLHGASLDTDAAGDALGSGGVLVLDDQAEGAGLGALAAAGAQLLADHVHAGLGILGDGTVGAGLGAQTALGADLGLGSALALHDLDAGLGDIIDLVECLGASLDTLQAGHALRVFLNSELLHITNPLCFYIIHKYYTGNGEKKQPKKQENPNFLVTCR